MKPTGLVLQADMGDHSASYNYPSPLKSAKIIYLRVVLVTPERWSQKTREVGCLLSWLKNSSASRHGKHLSPILLARLKAIYGSGIA